MYENIEDVGPREDERQLAGMVAGALWLSVLPMLCIGLLLPGTDTSHWQIVLAISAPAAAWGAVCLFFIPWEHAGPLVFHLPSVLALPYIGVIVAFTGDGSSPFFITFLMLIVFCSYFYPPRTAIPYIVGCLIVQAFPLLYDAGAVDDGLLTQLWASAFVYAAVGSVVLIGKQQLVQLRDSAREQSLQDSLTGLANRRAFTELLNRVGGGSRESDTLGLLLLDIDDFKEVNTLYGLPGGDRVLRFVADMLQEFARAEDMVVRFGGDEFAIACPGPLTESGMQRLAERAIGAISDAGKRMELPGFELTASAGWALYPRDASTVNELIELVDLSLRAAKIAGKNRAQSALDWTSASMAPAQHRSA
jgi:diguanylate cyclase (GGDEF)-like protein